MEFPEGVDGFQKKLASALVATTRSAGIIGAEDLKFQRQSNPQIGQELDEQSDRLRLLANRLTKFAAPSGVRPPKIADVDGVDDNWRSIVDIVDVLLEKADASLDEFTGAIKKLTQAEKEKRDEAEAHTARFPNVYDASSSQMAKPQLQFMKVPTNDETTPWRPLLTSKPHALVPLEKKAGPEGWKQPYETEIQRSTYPPAVRTKAPPVEYKPMKATEATFVDTIEGVHEMLAELKKAKEIAVDLEHHDVHTFIGLVSLMQISTRNKDWIVDTLQPWREELQVLNEVFADPTILKVFHGSAMDIIWLQRDLGLYVVGLFDTYWASVALGFEKKSLKYLLEKFTDFRTNKKYQMADWRVRPLPGAMFDYARADTHYLLYIFDHVRNLCIDAITEENNPLDFVLEKSKMEASQRYERPIYDAKTGNGVQGFPGWFDMIKNSSEDLNPQQFAVFKAVHQWRDSTARKADESSQCVMSKHALLSVAREMPTDRATLLRWANSSYIRDDCQTILDAIAQAKKDGEHGENLRDLLTQRGKKPKWEDETRPAATQNQIRRDLPGSRAAKLRELLHSKDDKELEFIASKLQTSQFWGDALKGIQSTADAEVHERNMVAALDALNRVFPIHDIPAFSAEDITAEPIPEVASPTPAGMPSAEKIRNEIFTIRDSRKRKSDVASTPQEYFDAVATNDSAESSDAAAAQKVKKPKFEEQDIIKFDYDAADNVMQPKRAGGGAAFPGKTKTPFNPYAKGNDAPQGVRKNTKEIAGRSFTFKK